jgi:rhodanese-related sulfurtransferase
MRSCAAFFPCVSVLLLAVPAFATETPAELGGATVVSAEKVKELVGTGARLFDVRVVAEFNEEHITGAVSLPYKENSKKEAAFDASKDKFDLAALGADKSAPLIFQCNGIECWKSYKASAAALKGGFKTVYWFRGGIPEWKAKGLPTVK